MNSKCIILILAVLTSCSKVLDVEPNKNKDNNITPSICENEILNKAEIYRPLSQFINTRTWYFYRNSDYFTLQDDLNNGLVFNETQYAKKIGGATHNWENYFISQSKSTLTLENYSSMVRPDVFEIIDLDAARMVLYNSELCPDSCYLVSSDFLDDLLTSICDEKDCSDNHRDCEDGRCVCDFGFIGKYCKSQYNVTELNFNFTLRNVMAVYNNYWVFDAGRDADDNIMLAVTSTGDVIWELEHKFNFFTHPFSQSQNEEIFFVDEQILYQIDTKNGNLSSSPIAGFGSDHNLYGVNLIDNAILGRSRIGLQHGLHCINKQGMVLWNKEFPPGYISHVGIMGDKFIVRTWQAQFLIYDIDGNLLLQKGDSHKSSVTETNITYFANGVLIYDSGIIYRYDEELNLIWESEYLKNIYGLYFRNFRVHTNNQNIYILLRNELIVLNDSSGEVISSFKFDDNHLPYPLNPIAFSSVDIDNIQIYGMPSNNSSDFISYISLKNNDLYSRLNRCPF